MAREFPNERAFQTDARHVKIGQSRRLGSPRPAIDDDGPATGRTVA